MKASSNRECSALKGSRGGCERATPRSVRYFRVIGGVLRHGPASVSSVRVSCYAARFWVIAAQRLF